LDNTPIPREEILAFFQKVEKLEAKLDFNDYQIDSIKIELSEIKSILTKLSQEIRHGQ
jgi:vacuolar-type H+-ATPase subunit I/STV1